MTKRIEKIDVHHHIMPSWYVEAVQAAGEKDAGGVAFPEWSVESALALMDRKGIGTAITSVAAPGVYFGDIEKAKALARKSNEYSAKLVADHPDRFGAYAVLPLPDVDAALAELAYATDVLKLDGVALLSNYRGRYPGDPAFDALFDEMNRRKTTIFVHPEVAMERPKLPIPGTLTEFVFDTTRAAANLIFSGTMERNPDLRIILAHMGGTVPYLAGRFALGALDPHLNSKAPKGAQAYLKRFYYETALSTSPTALASAQEIVEPSRILFGSDHPFAPEKLIDAEIQGLERYAGFDAETRERIERDNALPLFPRLAAATVRS
jgi:predicted TIM-barrel fold metal-dependent hydrolase